MAAIGLPARAARLARAGWLLLNAVQLAYTLLVTACGICVALLVLALSRRPQGPLRMASWYWAPALLGGAGARLEVEGADAIDWSRPLVLACNHQSIIDVCALFRAVPVPLRFVLKQEMAKVPFVGRYARALGMVFIDRGHPRDARRSLMAAVGLLRGGAVLCAFPEGTRSRDARVGPFKGGAFQLAIEAGAAVVPVAISGSGAVLPPWGFAVRPGTIRVRFGAPMETSGLAAHDRVALAARTREAVVALAGGH